jgi:PAS domain S-box-containing protein
MRLDTYFTAILEKILSEAPILIMLFQESFLYINPYAEKSLGYSIDELKGVSLWEVLVEEEDQKVMRKTIEKQLRGEQISTHHKEIKIKTKDGGVRILRLYTTTVKLNTDFSVLAVGVDITKEKKLEEQLRLEKQRIIKLKEQLD